MAISKKILALTAMAALSFGAYGCTDDSGSESNTAAPQPQPQPECTADVCSGDILNKCEGGKITPIDCTENNQVCSGGKCEDKGNLPTCTEADTKCDGDVLKKCEGGTLKEIDCSANNQTCSNNACVPKSGPVDKECEGDTAVCDHGVLRKCVNNKFENDDCEAKGQICNAESKACEPCTADISTCDGQVLTVCNNGKVEKTDCTQSNQLCDLKSLSCKYECENTEAPTCENAGVQKVCENNKYKLVECTGENAYCNAGECKNHTAEELCLAEGKVYQNGECIVPQSSVIGGECKCLNNCEIVITGKEIKDVISKDLQKFYLKASVIGIDVNVANILSKLKDDDKIIAPNYFPGAENIEGCTDLNAPAGMTAGCFYDATIQFPAGLSSIIKDDIVPILNNSMVKGMIGDADFAGLATKMADEYFTPGIKFTSPKGYCITAAIDIGDKLEASAKVSTSGMVSLFVQTNGFDGNVLASDPLNKETGLVKKINTGDHATVVSSNEAAIAAGELYCPEGSTLFSYSILKNIEMANKGFDMNVGVGAINASLKQLFINANVGFDMCLRSCVEDADCQREDYECVDLPNGVPQTVVDEEHNCKRVIEPPKKKGCFDKANIDYFEEMTDKFEMKAKDELPDCED